MGTLFVISAPSGAGKTSLVSRRAQTNTERQVSISHTTRAKRPQEVEGINYHFIDRPSFEQMVRAGQFLESAEVFGNLYGTSQVWVEEQLKAGTNVILEIDWQGAAQIAKLMPCVRIFILPPSKQILEQRLRQRAQDSLESIQRRLSGLREEISHYGEYDYLVVNDDFEKAILELQAIVISQRVATSYQVSRLQPLLGSLLALD
jgi:guanylate kinase